MALFLAAKYAQEKGEIHKSLSLTIFANYAINNVYHEELYANAECEFNGRAITTKIASGYYENASEVVRAGLRSLEREEQEHEAKVAALRTAIDLGDASGIAEDGVFARVRTSLDHSA